MSFETDLIQMQLDRVWPGWRVSPKKLGHGSYGDVYEIYRNSPETNHAGFELVSALKVLRIEADQQDDLTASPPTMNMFQNHEHENRGENTDGGEGRSITRRLIQGSETEALYQNPDLAVPSMSESMIEDFVQNVSSEINLMIRLKGHPHIVSIEDYAVLKEEGSCTILIRMEKLRCLSKDLKSGKRMDQREVIRMGMELCNALDCCEKNRIIHRDIKPSNIYYDDGKSYKIGDFGISRTMESIYEQASMSKLGTLDYMAPEIYRGESYNNSADIYSLGIVLYECLNGTLPMCGQGVSKREAFHRRMQGERLRLPANADPGLGQVVLKACAFSPRERYATAGELYRELKECLGRLDHDEPDRKSRSLLETLKDNLKIVLGAIAAVMIAILVIVAVKGRASGEEEPSNVEYTVALYDEEGNMFQEETFEGCPGEVVKYTAPDLDGYMLDDHEGAMTLSKDPDENRLEFTYTKVEDAEKPHAGTDLIEWSDEILKEAVYGYLNYVGEMTYDEASEIRELECKSAGIENIDTLRYFTNLEKLSLPDNKISDLSPVSGLTRLRKINAEVNQIADLSPLSEMTWLKEVDLRDNYIQSVAPLENLVNLTMLDIRRNRVSDLSPLRNMTDMKELFISSNRLKDISPIAGMTKLVYLTISFNEVEDIGVLRNMTDMRVLAMTDNRVKDISVIRNMDKLYHLKIRGNNITDKSPLEGFPESGYLEQD